MIRRKKTKEKWEEGREGTGKSMKRDEKKKGMKGN